MHDQYADCSLPTFGACQPSGPALSRRALSGSLAVHLLVVLSILGLRAASEPPKAEPSRLGPLLMYSELAPAPPRVSLRRKLTPPVQAKPGRVLAPPQLAERWVERPVLRSEAPPAPPSAPPERAKIALPDAASAIAQPARRPGQPVQLGSFSAPVVEKSTLARVPAVTGAFAGAANMAAKPVLGAVATGGFGEASASRNQRQGAGTTAGAGFGDAVARTEPVESKQVRAGGFQSAVATAAPRATVQAAEQGSETPVAILDKPRPSYTEEARQLKIEGEVLLEVLFAASGKAHVQRVIRGLGHGLDESAVRSAEAIRFRPAMRGGAPVDATAVARITFQLAY